MIHFIFYYNLIDFDPSLHLFDDSRGLEDPSLHDTSTEDCCPPNFLNL